MKGKKAVEHSIKLLESFGFLCSKAQSENSNGHDIVAIKNGRGYTFEVKPVRFISRSFRVEKIRQLSLNDK